MEKCPSKKQDRKTVEKNRRHQMKSLYTTLHSLVTGQNSRLEVPMLSDQLEEATSHIKSMQNKLERLKETKKGLLEIKEVKDTRSTSVDYGTGMEMQVPHIEIRDLGSALVVLLISGMDSQLMFYQCIRVLEEEGAEVVNAGFFVMGDKVLHTIHTKISDYKIDFKVERVSERLNKLVHETSDACKRYSGDMDS